MMNYALKQHIFWWICVKDRPKTYFMESPVSDRVQCESSIFISQICLREKGFLFVIDSRWSERFVCSNKCVARRLQLVSVYSLCKILDLVRI